MKNIPVVTFLQRTWMLFVAMFASNWFALTETHFAFLGKWVMHPEAGGIWISQTPMETFGPILWVLPFGLAIVLMGLLVVHLYYRQTIDLDANGGRYVNDWNSCTPFQRVLISNVVRIGIIIGLCILCAGLARAGDVPKIDQAARWDAADVSPKYRMALDVELARYRRTQARYEVIQNMKPHGVPAPILFCLHYREASNDFHCSLAQGDSLLHRSRNVPRGRIPDKEPPYSWEECAYDSVYVVEKPPLDRIDWTDGQAALDEMTAYNGWGYERRGMASPYLWSGTTLYKSGKFVRDGVFDRNAVDGQLGCCAILKHFMDHGISLSFVQ